MSTKPVSSGSGGDAGGGGSESAAADQSFRGVVVRVEMSLHLRVVEEGLEPLLRDELCSCLMSQTAGPPEMIRVRVGDDHRVHVVDRELGSCETIKDGGPGGLPRHAGVHDGGAPLVEQRVGVDMAEPSEVDRQLQPQDARADLGDLG